MLTLKQLREDKAEAVRRLQKKGVDAEPIITRIEELDDKFIEKNLSPGGCADLLAVTYLLSKIKSGV